MGVLYLTVELILDLLACLLGGILMLRARDNGPKFWWGSIALAIGGVFAWENIDWLLIVAEEPDYRFTDLLDMEKMLKWYPLASIVALFPLASLFPGYLTWKRTLLYLAPSFLITAIGAGYLAWYGELTPLYDFTEVVVHMDHPDVWFRCILFLLSIVTPLAFFLYPLLNRKGYRRVNSMMYVFMGFMFLFLCIYVLFTWDISYFVFNLFGATAIVFTLFFSWQYLLRENPFSVYDAAAETARPASMAGDPLPLFREIENYFQGVCPGRTGYTLQQLSEALHQDEQQISEAVKSAGYSSFHEYINDLRLEAFRRAALQYPEKNIKELIYLSGFRSRATFYRNFSDKYGMSPSGYLETLRRQEDLQESEEVV